MNVFEGPGASVADRSSWLAIDHRSHASIRVVMHALRNGADVRRLLRPHFDAGCLLDPGAWLIAGDHALDGMSLARKESLRTWLVRPVPQGTVTVAMPRVGVHVPYSSKAVDVGWLRLMLETSGIPYSVLTDEDLRSDNIGDLDTIAFAHQTPEDLLNGVQGQGYPEPFADGVGTSGLSSLNRFLEAGGHAIAIDGALRALAAPLRLPIRFPLASMTNDLFASPGAVVKVEPNTADPLMIGIDEPFAAMLDSKNAFASRSPHAHPNFAAHFAADPLLSGWMRNGTLLSGLGAIGHFQVGAGSVAGFAFKPHFRTQMLASYLPLINAIMRTSREDHGDHVTR